MKIRKGKGFALLLVASACFLTSCKGTDHSDGVTLSLVGKKSDLEKSYMTSIFEQYETATGNKLKIIPYEDSEFEDSASELFAAGEAPDLFMHFHNADLSRFEVSENFYYLNEEAWVEDLTDSAAAYCRDAEGNLLGLPFWENSVSGCYYNKTVLDSLGLKPATTQKEFDVLCQALVATGITPLCWPADGCSWMPQFGMDPIFADDPSLLEKINHNEISYADIPQMRDMVQWLSDAAQKGWFGADYLETGWDEISHDMASGKAVMTFIWDTWFYTDLEPEGTYTVDDFAVMPVFMNTVPEGTYEGGNLNMMMVNKNSEHLDEALEFLSFCATPEHYNAAFDGISTVNCFKGQTTNIQSQMVTDAEESIAGKERVSTASTRIIGYSAVTMKDLLNDMFRGKLDVDSCLQRMDESRIAAARGQGAEGF